MARTDKDTEVDDPKDILAQARKDYDAAYERERDNIAQAYDDLTFLAGDNQAQWPELQRNERELDGRPVLQINQLPQFVHQITGDIRQMRPAIKVVPVDDDADEKVAELRGGLIRYIENRSDAAAIYFRAADSQVGCGIGHWRILTEYADNSTFNQEIRIGPVEDGISVVWDPDAILPSKDDARYCFVPVDMSRNKFKATYPDAVPEDFSDPKWQYNHDWLTDDYVRVAEYWCKVPTKKQLALLPNGSINDLTGADEATIAQHVAQGAKVEERDSTKVVRYLITASEVLEGPEDWPGRYIPIVPLVGEETRIGRKLIRHGIVRNAKDAQRMSNYFHSAHAETVALQPKAPYLLTEVNIGKYQDTWEEANTKNFPYLPYQPDPANGGQMPSRIAPPVSSQGVLDGVNMAMQDLRSVIGIYDASLGKQSPETSGRAIIARQREGDTGSYLYIDNFARAVRQTGNIINDLIPYIYDSERTIRVMGVDGKIDVMAINKANGIDPNTRQTIYDNDVTVGSYDVVAEMGPSYTTKQAEARDGLAAFMQAAPESAALLLDIFAKAQDWPMSDEIAERMRATLPAKILQIDQLKKQGATSDQIDQALLQQASQPPPPDPKIALAQQQHNDDMQVQMSKLQLQNKDIETNAQLKIKELQDEMTLAMNKIAAQIHESNKTAETKQHETTTAANLKAVPMIGEQHAQMMATHAQIADQNSQALAMAASALQQTAAALQGVPGALGQVAQVLAADSEIVRDPKTGQALRARKVVPTLQ